MDHCFSNPYHHALLSSLMHSSISDLLPGQSYTVYISSENCVTDQLSENQSTAITASIEASTLECKKHVSDNNNYEESGKGMALWYCV